MPQKSYKAIECLVIGRHLGIEKGVPSIMGGLTREIDSYALE